MSGGVEPAGARLERLLQEAGMAPLGPELASRFEFYLSLFLRWNARINLSAVRDEEDILSRHFVESIACARALPGEIATLLDFGSGGGLPGIPIALCRTDIEVTLAESQEKKAAFLQEAVRTLGISANVYAGRAETLDRHFDCVALRAVDRMEEAVRSAADLVASNGWLALMTTRKDVSALQATSGTGFSWREACSLPASADRILVLGVRSVSSPA